MSRLRAFIAVDPGPAVRDRIIALQATLARAAPDVKWVEPDNLHVTLLFLGEVVDTEIPAVCRVVAEKAREQPAFSMTVEGVGCFPTPRRPKTVWVGVGDGAEQLCAVHDALEGPLEALGYRREERRFTPHVTLGRVKGEGSADELAAALARHAGWKGGETAVEEIRVMSSELTPRGPVYTVLSRAKLG